jgi:hypothetical protein
MWFALEPAPQEGEGAATVLPQLEAVLRFTHELQERLATVGVDGISGALGLYRHLSSVLDAIPEAEIARMQEQISALARGLAELRRSLDEVQRLKRLLAT